MYFKIFLKLIISIFLIFLFFYSFKVYLISEISQAFLEKKLKGDSFIMIDFYLSSIYFPISYFLDSFKPINPRDDNMLEKGKSFIKLHFKRLIISLATAISLYALLISLCFRKKILTLFIFVLPNIFYILMIVLYMRFNFIYLLPFLFLFLVFNDFFIFIYILKKQGYSKT